MKKLCVLFFAIFIFFLVGNHIEADEQRFEKLYFKGGYTEVYKALEESEKYFRKDIALPTQLPPVAFTHNFGRFSTFGNNPQFEITFLNKDLGQNHYEIRIQPVKNKLEFKEEQIDQTLRLKDGTKAVYSTQHPLNLLAFEKDDWQYILLIDKRISNKVTKDILVEIANSID